MSVVGHLLPSQWEAPENHPSGPDLPFCISMCQRAHSQPLRQQAGSPAAPPKALPPPPTAEVQTPCKGILANFPSLGGPAPASRTHVRKDMCTNWEVWFPSKGNGIFSGSVSRGHRPKFRDLPQIPLPSSRAAPEPNICPLYRAAHPAPSPEYSTFIPPPELRRHGHGWAEHPGAPHWALPPAVAHCMSFWQQRPTPGASGRCPRMQAATTISRKWPSACFTEIKSFFFFFF